MANSLLSTIGERSVCKENQHNNISLHCARTEPEIRYFLLLNLSYMFVIQTGIKYVPDVWVEYLKTIKE